MNRIFPLNKQSAFYVVYLLLAGAVGFRMIPYFENTPFKWIVIGLFLIYGLLLVTERLITRYLSGYPHVYFVVQVAIFVLFLYVPTSTAPKDYFGNLMIPLCGQAMWDLKERPARLWVAGIAFFSLLSMLVSYEGLEGVNFGLTYVAGCLLVSVLSAATIRADQAHARSLALVLELQAANQKLQDYARQVELLAAAEERNRLARELHDSVSQTIFSMNLTAQSAKILLQSEPSRVAGLLEHLQALSQNALAEMRTLIQELRPHAITSNGLIPALRKHAFDRLNQDGLKVTLQVNGERRLPEETEEELFRIVQEALNNVVKHAQTDQATVSVEMTGGQVFITVTDQGIGFNPDVVRTQSGHVGLSSMEERVGSLGGALTIESAPGRGTCLKLTNIPVATG